MARGGSTTTIGETDRDARAYVLGLASEVPGPDTWDRYEQRQLQA